MWNNAQNWKKKEKEIERKEKELEKEVKNLMQKEVHNITFGDFLLPKRKRTKSNNSELIKMTTSTPKKKKQRKQKSKPNTPLNSSSEMSDSDDETKKSQEKSLHTPCNERNNKTKEKETIDSSDEVFETIKTETSIIKTLSENDSNEKKKLDIKMLF